MIDKTPFDTLIERGHVMDYDRFRAFHVPINGHQLVAFQTGEVALYGTPRDTDIRGVYSEYGFSICATDTPDWTFFNPTALDTPDTELPGTAEACLEDDKIAPAKIPRAQLHDDGIQRFFVCNKSGRAVRVEFGAGKPDTGWPQHLRGATAYLNYGAIQPVGSPVQYAPPVAKEEVNALKEKLEVAHQQVCAELLLKAGDERSKNVGPAYDPMDKNGLGYTDSRTVRYLVDRLRDGDDPRALASDMLVRSTSFGSGMMRYGVGHVSTRVAVKLLAFRVEINKLARTRQMLEVPYVIAKPSQHRAKIR